MKRCHCEPARRGAGVRRTDRAAGIDEHLERGDLADDLIFDAVRMRLIEIGEAVKAMPRAVIDAEPSIPWRDMAKMRDHLTHRYFDIEHSIVDATVRQDLPSLRAVIERWADRLRPL